MLTLSDLSLTQRREQANFAQVRKFSEIHQGSNMEASRNCGGDLPWMNFQKQCCSPLDRENKQDF